jgi:hypothetical protein
MVVSRPYRDSVNNSIKIRVFDESVDREELAWHRDERDRRVTVLESSGWKLQTDDSLPIDLIEGNSYFIKKDEWHRVLKGKGSLKIKIEEF